MDEYDWVDEVFSSHESIRGYIEEAVGSRNHDCRGKIMNGEVLFVTSGLRTGVASLDLLELLLVSTWVDEVETLDRLMPGLQRVQAEAEQVHRACTLAREGVF